jgi:hypothetical protein
MEQKDDIIRLEDKGRLLEEMKLNIGEREKRRFERGWGRRGTGGRRERKRRGPQFNY